MPQRAQRPRKWMYLSKTLSRSGIRLFKDNHCQLCRSNREPEFVYLGHLLRDEEGKISCPVLRRHVCCICGATGDAAHTFKYCPFNFDVPLKLRNANFETARAAAAKLLGLETVPVVDEHGQVIYVAVGAIAERRLLRMASPEISATIEGRNSEVTRASQTEFEFDELSPTYGSEFSEILHNYKDAMIQTDEEDEVTDFVFDEMSPINETEFLYNLKDAMIQTDEEDGMIF